MERQQGGGGGGSPRFVTPHPEAACSWLGTRGDAPFAAGDAIIKKQPYSFESTCHLYCRYWEAEADVVCTGTQGQRYQQ